MALCMRDNTTIKLRNTGTDAGFPNGGWGGGRVVCVSVN